MNVFILKIIALISMIIDHYGAIFHSDIELYRIIGRSAFPIYCFLLVEGYTHTSDVKRYLKRLFIFAIISEIPFDLAFYGKIEFLHQNIFFTLSIGLLAIYLIDDNGRKFNFSRTTVYIGTCLIATLFFVDYSFIGIIYILQFYQIRNLPNAKGLLNVALIMFLINLFSAGWIQQFSLLALPIIYLHNGKLGLKNKFIQFFFYAAYPLHLMIFYIVNLIKI
ncbi:MAG: TraX family protein [Tissierellaceae bacterium]|nr:TraX family protein [Tissierellaceae bacterium]